MRSGLWLHGAFPGPNDSSYGDFKHVFCVITTVSYLNIFSLLTGLHASYTYKFLEHAKRVFLKH